MVILGYLKQTIPPKKHDAFSLDQATSGGVQQDFGTISSNA
jgi:hypothetical protein